MSKEERAAGQPLTVQEYAVQAAQTCGKLSGSERDLLARLIGREIRRNDRKRAADGN